MEFEYTGYIYIEESDLDEMAKRVLKGEDFYTVFYDVMSGYDDAIYLDCELIEEQVEIEVKKRTKKTLLFSQFVESYCLACGGDWTKMIADGIERAFPEIYEEKVKDKELSFKDLIDILWKDCEVVFD